MEKTDVEQDAEGCRGDADGMQRGGGGGKVGEGV